MVKVTDAVDSVIVDPKIVAAIDKLGPALLDYPLETAIDALTRYLHGASLDAVFRSTGIPRCRVDKWVKIAGLTRSRDEVKGLCQSKVS